MVRTPACHAGGRGFESRPFRLRIFWSGTGHRQGGTGRRFTPQKAELLCGVAGSPRTAYGCGVKVPPAPFGKIKNCLSESVRVRGEIQENILRWFQNYFYCNLLFSADTSSSWREMIFTVILLRLKSFRWLSSSRLKISKFRNEIVL